MIETAPSHLRITVTDTHDLVVAADACREASAQRRFGLLAFVDAEVRLCLLEGGDAVVVGRERPSEIVIDDPSVSRQHARFVREDGEIWVEDLESRNGTLLRGKPLQRAKLEPGDEVSVGRARIVVAATQASPSVDATSVAEGDLVLRSARMKQVYADVGRVADVQLPVLILGETGVGKEHVASALHRQGGRRDKPFVAINCATIPASLLESTLFGHERGAFTGAIQRATGVFERAHGGVLFLDEIGDLAWAAQAALLRVMETRCVSRVGSSLEIPVDVRIVAATHCDLEAMVEEGTFRRDLYFRLNGIQLDVPALRERPEEIEPLVRLFLRKARSEWNARAEHVSQEALAILSGYAWPGNVRQLRYAVERASLVAQDTVIEARDLPQYVFDGRASAKVALPEPSFEQLALRQQLRRYECALIDEALRQACGNRQAAAKLLRIPLRTLFRKLRGTPREQEQGSEP
jgi:DNA-binding NtrC family response regulator